MFFLYVLLFPQVDDSVFCAGQIALVPCTMQLVKAGTRTQAHLSFSYVKKVLDAVIGGLTLAAVVQAHCYATRRQDIPTIRAIWESMLREAKEEKVSPALFRVVLMERIQLIKKKRSDWLFYYRYNGNIDWNDSMMLKWPRIECKHI